jgi:hypothetical protein
MREPTRYTRKNLPAEYTDPDRWPQLELNQLDIPARAWAEARQRAVRGYLAGGSLTAISAEFKVTKAEILRLLNRCVAPHEDGRINGWRAVRRYRRIHMYERMAAIPAPGRRGLAGVFTRFLRDHAQIKEILDVYILKGKSPDSLPESRLAHAGIYAQFCRSCARAGIARTQYPFTTKDEGRAALARYVKQLLETRPAHAAARLGGPDAALRMRVGIGHRQHVLGNAPFDVCSIDAHQINCVGTVGIPTRGRLVYIPIARLHFLPLMEHDSHCVLGYHIVIARQPSAPDVVQAVVNAMTEWKPRALSVPGLVYPPGAQMPSALPEMRGHAWSMLLMDNATIHYAPAPAERLRRRIGCALNFGPVRQWYRRPLIEGLFSILERRGFLRLPNSTGTGPQDPLRADAAKVAVDLRITFEGLLDLIDLMVCTYNGTEQDDLGHRSPLQALSDAVLGAETFWLPRLLPPVPRHIAEMDVEVLVLPIRGNNVGGRRPYVQYRGVRYTNQILANAMALVGAQLTVHVRPSDLRTILAFFASGEELGTLTALGQWSQTRHDIKLRKDVCAALKNRTLTVPPGTDPVSAYLVALAQQAVAEQETRRGRPRVSNTATKVARAVTVTGLPVPQVPTPAKPAPQIPALESSPGVQARPSFMPKVIHRGTVK